ncbi:MAG: Spy/CpxP family protein refolding chaperone [Syntrophobacteraceae bacterium]
MTAQKGRAAALWAMGLVLAAALVLGPATGSFAGERRAGRHGGGSHGIEGLAADLNLSKAQKHSIALILKDHRAEARECVANLRAARKNLFTAVRAPEYNEPAVRQAARDVSHWQEEMAVRRAQIVHEIQKVLSPEQKEKLVARRAKFGDKIERRFQERFDRLDRWIDANAS